MPMQDLENAFVEELRDVLSAEKQLVRALKQMSKKAANEELKAAFEQHLEQTEGQIERLEQVFEELNMKPRAKHCMGMAGLLEEGKEILEQDGEAPAKDALLIASAQKVEHYEIAAYGTLCAWADQLGLTRAKRLLEETLAEEKKTDEKLTMLAKKVNQAATPV